MKVENLISIIISSFMFIACQPQNAKNTPEKTQPTQSTKIMIENPVNGKPVEVEVEYTEDRYVLGGDMIVEPYVMKQ